jgi:hypothetical protein
MRTGTLVLSAGGVLLAALVVLWHTRGRLAAAPTLVRAESTRPQAGSPTLNTNDQGATTNDSMARLRSIARNVSMTATGAIASYEVRGMIADRLRTNEAFLRWATNAATTAVGKLAGNAKIPIHGTKGLAADNLKLSVDVRAAGGLYAEAVYDQNTNSEGPLYFIVEGGTNPVVGLVQNQYRMASYQLDPQSWGSSQYPRTVGRMDWGNATSPLDPSLVEGMAKEAYFAMTGSELPPNLVPKIDVSGVTDPTVQDPDVQVIGKQGATVATVNNQRYPFAIFQFGEPDTLNQPFSGEMFQSQPGQPEIVNLFVVPNLRNAVLELGDEFLGPSSGDWAQEVLNNVGSTPSDQVLRKMWKMPNR